MCLLIWKPKGKEIPKAHLERGFEVNSNGAGFGFIKEGDANPCHIQKGFFDFNAFYKAYEAANLKDVNAIVHFRIATHGSKNESNCHPHIIGGGWMMGHNGIISDVKIRGDESDTVAFARDELTEFLNRNNMCIDDKEVLKCLDDRIGVNKLVFLHESGKSIIMNEKIGTWKDGVWYSNSSFTPSCAYNHYNNTNRASSYDRWESDRRAAAQARETIKGGKVRKDLPSELAEMYDELIEIRVPNGCCVCKKKPASLTFFYNQFTGECICEECVRMTKETLLLPEKDDNDDAAGTEKEAVYGSDPKFPEKQDDGGKGDFSKPNIPVT